LQTIGLDTIAENRGYNYIFPNFRGVNNHAKACCSEFVIADIDEAIDWALKNLNVDKNRIFIVGYSGGGLATLAMYQKSRHKIRAFSAWAPISDLEVWYQQSVERKNRYANDIIRCLGTETFDAQKARERSPLAMQTPVKKRKKSTLQIFAGIHDGYTGSVPVSQSIDMFNKLLSDMYPEQSDKKISDSLKLLLVTKQINPNADSNLLIGDRRIHLIRELPNLNFTLFEGTHEMLVPQALPLIQIDEKLKAKSFHILTISDSNGTFEYSWPQQLKKLLPYSTVVNRSISGNTIGFDNLDRIELNTLKNINRYLDEAYAEIGEGQKFDYILINLGTNDTKCIFEKRQKEVPENMKTLIEMTRQYMTDQKKDSPEIYIVSTSPMAEEEVNAEKYGGGDSRIQKNNQLFKKLAVKMNINFIDSYSVLKPGFSEKTVDGVHLIDKGQYQLASVIADWINSK